MAQKEISFHILMQYPPFAKAVKENDKETFESILYEAGIDTSLPYEIDSVEHRPYPDKPLTFNGPIAIGNERRDEAYIASGLASWEVKRELIRDPELRADLANMGREGSADKAFVKYDSKNYSKE